MKQQIVYVALNEDDFVPDGSEPKMADICGATSAEYGYACTTRAGHPGTLHTASDGDRIVAIWREVAE